MPFDLDAATPAEILAEMERISDEAEEWPLIGRAARSYQSMYERAREQLTTLGKIRELAAQGSAEDGTGFDRNTGGSASTPRHRSQAAQAAMRTVERSVRSGALPAYAAERVETLVSTGAPQTKNLAARWAVAAGADAYASAFARLVADPERGHLMWSPAEQRAYRVAAEIQSELRAMSSTDAAGGFMVPLALDPAIILTNDGSLNPLRAISRVVQTVTDSWSGITSAGVTAEWTAEAAEVADAAPTVGNPVIPVYKGDAFVPYSFEVGMDAVDLLGQLQILLADGADQLMATAYTTGPGTTAPTGIVTALAGTASEINTTGSEALAAADAYALQNALGARWQARARWAAALPTINVFAQFETTNGALKFPELRESPPRLLSRPMSELSNLDSTVVPAATANNYVLLYGDFQNFVIVDRIGTSLELIPNLFGANRRPTGQRGALLWFRTGSDSVNDSAFKLLDVPTTA